MCVHTHNTYISCDTLARPDAHVCISEDGIVPVSKPFGQLPAAADGCNEPCRLANSRA